MGVFVELVGTLVVIGAGVELSFAVIVESIVDALVEGGAEAGCEEKEEEK